MDSFFQHAIGIELTIEAGILRIFCSFIAGAIMGLERKLRMQFVGMRTLVLISVSSCLIMMLSIYTSQTFHPISADPARLAAQVVSGIGFLGGGAILREGFNVKGLTSAAIIWTAAALGLSFGAGFFIGFILSMAGIAIISFSGSELKLNPFGDLLALLAAVTWACYSVLTKKISSFGYNTLLTTRRIFCYGIIFMIPVIRFMDFSPDISSLIKPLNFANLLFLGLGASAACFVTWNYAVKLLGAVRTSVYIYLVPVITVIASILILKEPFTFMTGLGTLLTLSGLICSEIKAGGRHKNKES